MPRHQQPVKGGRVRASSSLEKRVEARIRSEAERFDVSRSFVVTVALADYFDIALFDDFRKAGRRVR